MPPVRWKLLLTALLAVSLLRPSVSIEVNNQQETISMTSDGWRPIIGSHRPEPSYQITLYRNPSQISETVKAETTTSPSSTKNPTSYKPSKLPPHSKHSQISQYYAMPGVLHAPHIPLGAVTVNRPPQIKKYPSVLHMAINGKRHVKPIRVQSVAHSARDEVFAPVPSTGSFSFFTQGPNNIKTRDTPLGHYSLNQPHIEYANRFIPPQPPINENIFQFNHPLQGFIFPKPQISNEINFQFPLNQNDDYTRNLVPPPFLNKEKTSTKKKETDNPPVIVKSRFPENVVQLPPPFTNNNKFSFPNTQQKDEPNVEITKEKLQVFHSNPHDYDYDFHSLKKQPLTSEPPKSQTYEVTEGGKWTDSSDFVSHISIANRRRKPTRQPEVELNVPLFLPTPYKPVPSDALVPTSPTQSEISTVFTKLSAVQKEKNQPTFNIKEVSTHYPIVGKPNFIETTPVAEVFNDSTTINEMVQIEEIITTTKEPVRTRPTRRRRPLTRKTTTEEPAVETDNYDLQKTQEVGEVPLRRPIRYRTTTPNTEESAEETTRNRGKNRHRYRNRNRNRPKIAETYSETPKEIEEATTENYRYQQTTRRETQEDSPEIVEITDRHVEENTVQQVEESEEVTTYQIPTTNLIIPEHNEILTTPKLEIEETTTSTTTTTTETPTTTKRIRGRPIKFDNSNRPRFSVKDYRQRLSQYSSTSTTETYQTSSESPRLRFPNRSRRPTTEPSELRTKVISKTTQEPETERPKLKRQYSRYRSTTPASSNSTPKVSIKPNLFSNRRRPPTLSLRSRIQNKYNRTDISTTTSETDTTDSEETTTEYGKKNRIVTAIPEDNDETTTDILKNEAFMYSQRVSDLTSSSKNEYNTPGLFKSLSPVSRRIPNYFTISTDDPILPIEAFFPNIKDKDKE